MKYRAKLSFLLVLLCLFSSFSAMSKPWTLKTDTGEILFEGELKGWRHLKNVFGIQNLYLKKTKEDKKSTVSITMTGKKIELNGRALARRIGDYDKGRRKWAKKKNIQISDFEEYQNFVNKNDIKYYYVGFNYSTPHLGSVHERSLYISCKDDSLIHAKFLLLKEHLPLEKSILDFFKSIKSCQNKSS